MVIDYDGKKIPNNRVPFNAPDDWLNHITISIQNKSAKAIVAGDLQLAFTTLVSNPMVFHYVRLGIEPEHEARGPSGLVLVRRAGKTSISVAPGDYIRFSLATDYDAIRSKIEARAPLSQATSVTIDYGIFYFEGGMRWDITAFSRVDPNTPGHYAPTTPEDLMGMP